MKGLILFLALSIGSVAGIAQQDAIDKYFSQHAANEDFSKVVVSSKMFELFAHMESSDDDEQELLEIISKLVGMRMLMNESNDNAKSLYSSAIKTIGKEFEVLMRVEDQQEDVTIYIKESGGTIAELVVIGLSSSEFFILSLLGEIDLKQVSKLSRSLNITGLEHLQNVDEAK